jgi:hypothetical protein
MRDTAPERLNVERLERPGPPPPMFLHKMFIRWDLARTIAQDVDSTADTCHGGTELTENGIAEPPGGFSYGYERKGVAGDVAWKLWKTKGGCADDLARIVAGWGGGLANDGDVI